MSSLKHSTPKPMDFVYVPDVQGNDLLLRHWQKVAVELIQEKISPDQFVQKMIETVHGKNKTVVLIDKDNPYPALMRIKDLCKGNAHVVSFLKDKTVPPILSVA